MTAAVDLTFDRHLRSLAPQIQRSGPLRPITLVCGERQEIHAAVLAAKRYTFIESGVTHPNFLDLLGVVTSPAQQQRVQHALGGVLTPVAA